MPRPDLDEPMAYIGKHSCGNVVLVIVDSPESKKENAKEMASAVRDGSIVEIERVTVEWVRANVTFCKCKKDRNNPSRNQQKTLPLGGNAQ